MNYSRITDQIYIGTNFCCGTHFDPELLKQGVVYDLSLEEGRVDSPVGAAAYLWLPIEDMHAPTEQQFFMGISFIDTAIKSGRKVYVHCKNGHGRAPTMVAGYFIANGSTTDEAIALIARKRPEIHLQSIQIDALRRFEQAYREQKRA
ncbi:MAG: dual specificity protein phosphatase [uncultured bacterium]|uniref:Uncharacterized protein n=2 Tax=Candidatus Wolfeibacteriota TaxID=1752735 RepID=A0A0G1H8X0_9BACT|nr:MAG: dual specificity protein phosphatase [uncultured bacterium]KKR12885.1 MAG: hypothetical protein UT41_C0001G0429 [Candidatus Wolfebacteria bacterium GW2011_GWC2_39_22]KKT43816.1 MAG: hypothetical protein UW32_C0001G0408 [Candidatus Wolfebacteria bacterium GW2011_GWE2_44_13]